VKTRLELAGQKFGRLTVLRFESLDARRNSYWRCVCECGQETVASGSNLKRGGVKSCGCLVHARVAFTVESHQDFPVYIGMIGRCNNPNMPNYGRYGGRGIKVCSRWVDGGFWAFLEDMGPRPSPSHSLDRIDTDGDYEPGNCRWATAKEQGRNRRNNKMLTYNGQTKPMSEWAEALGINPHTLKTRIRKGWSVEEAVTGRRILKVQPS
jgi:hypothetical protein